MFLTGTLAVLHADTRVTGAVPPFVTPWQPGITRTREKNILQKPVRCETATGTGLSVSRFAS